MRNRQVVRSISFVLTVIFLCATVLQAAEAPTYETARHEAFARGGPAISEALNYNKEAATAAPRSIE